MEIPFKGGVQVWKCEKDYWNSSQTNEHDLHNAKH